MVSISFLSVVVFSSHFSSNLNRTFCKQTVLVETLLQNAASDLGLHCLPVSHKKAARLIWIKNHRFMSECWGLVRWCVTYPTG